MILTFITYESVCYKSGRLIEYEFFNKFTSQQNCTAIESFQILPDDMRLYLNEHSSVNSISEDDSENEDQLIS